MGRASGDSWKTLSALNSPLSHYRPAAINLHYQATRTKPKLMALEKMALLGSRTETSNMRSRRRSQPQQMRETYNGRRMVHIHEDCQAEGQIEIGQCCIHKSRNVTPNNPILRTIDSAAGLEQSRTCVHRLLSIGAEVKKGWKPFDVWK
jgi:hypothetical protein